VGVLNLIVNLKYVLPVSIIVRRQPNADTLREMKSSNSLLS